MAWEQSIRRIVLNSTIELTRTPIHCLKLARMCNVASTQHSRLTSQYSDEQGNIENGLFICCFHSTPTHFSYSMSELVTFVY